MNCCDEYGDCSQSDDCPVRTGKVLPHQARHAARVARVKSTRPAWLNGKGVPPEAGNFKIVDLTPDDIGAGLGAAEGTRLVYVLVFWLVALVATVGAVALVVAYGTERWPDALWSYLAQLS
jgi:hypothetical protein